MKRATNEWTYRMIAWSSLWLLALGAGDAVAKTITVDGDPSDWTGTPGGSVHSVVISEAEWIYKGESGDMRTDPSDPSEPNYDLTEVRLHVDSGNLYFLVRLADVITTNEVHIGIGIDSDANGSDGALNWLGDDSGVMIADATNYVERNIAIHNATDGITEIELYADDGSSWYAPPGSEASYISTTNNVVEASIPLADLGLTGSSVIRLVLATFDNGSSVGGEYGWNNDTDTTIDYPTCDAVDVMGGTEGVSANAWDRDLSDGSLNLVHTVNLGLLPVEHWWIY